MSFELSTEGPHKVLKISGELNLYNVSKLRNEIYKFIDENENLKSVVMDMIDVSMMDSSGIALLTHLQRKIKDGGSSFFLVNLNNTIMTTLRLSSLDRYFQIFHSISEIPLTR